MRKHIPNLITGMNVVCGTIAVFLAIYGRIEWAAAFILLGMVFDFFDGMVARLLHVKSELGKELDSLADVVSFGVAPAVIVHFLLREILLPGENMPLEVLPFSQQIVLFVPILIPLFSAFRLAKFNLDVRQTTSFIGLPVPAHALFWVGLVFARPKVPYLYASFFGNEWVIVIYVLILSLLLVSELPMFSLKIQGWSWKENKIRYVYFLILLFIAVVFGWAILVFVIPVYILLCAFQALFSLSRG